MTLETLRKLWNWRTNRQISKIVTPWAPVWEKILLFSCNHCHKWCFLFSSKGCCSMVCCSSNSFLSRSFLTMMNTMRTVRMKRILRMNRIWKMKMTLMMKIFPNWTRIHFYLRLLSHLPFLLPLLFHPCQPRCLLGRPGKSERNWITSYFDQMCQHKIGCSDWLDSKEMTILFSGCWMLLHIVSTLKVRIFCKAPLQVRWVSWCPWWSEIDLTQAKICTQKC